MSTEVQENEGLPVELRDGDERLDLDPEPSIEPPPDGTEEDYPVPGT